MEDNFKHFCILPFWGGEYYDGQFSKHCCLFKDSYPDYDISSIRKMHLLDQPAAECSECYTRERSGLPSNRSINYYAGGKMQMSTETLFSMCQHPPYYTKFLKIYNSNTCNLTCVTCSDYFSSSWGKLLNTQKRLKPMTFTDEEIVNWEQVLFLGGEPLLDKSLLLLMERIYLLNKNCHISLSTNGTIINSDILSILSKFQNIDISISVDGVGKHFEYIRFGGRWEFLERNISAFKKISAIVGISVAVSNLNVLYYDRIESWAEEKFSITPHPNIVNEPFWFASSNIPPSIRDKFPQAEKFFLTEFNPDYFEKFKIEIAKQDSLKGISIKDYMPDLYTLLWDPNLKY